LLYLCICSQRLCYHDALIHCNAPRRGWPHDLPKRVVVIQCIYNNFIYVCAFYVFNSHTYSLLGCDIVYHCWMIHFVTVSCQFVQCITKLNAHFRLQFISNSATHASNQNKSSNNRYNIIYQIIYNISYSYYSPYYSFHNWITCAVTFYQRLYFTITTYCSMVFFHFNNS